MPGTLPNAVLSIFAAVRSKEVSSMMFILKMQKLKHRRSSLSKLIKLVNGRASI